MEQTLDEKITDINNDNCYFKLEHRNQKVKNLPSFQKWYQETSLYIQDKNIQRRKDPENQTYNIYIIEYCDNCLSYAIFTLKEYSFYIICSNCGSYICAGCQKPQIDDSVCLKGFIKCAYLNIIYSHFESDKLYGYYNGFILFLWLFLTPLYLGLVSFGVGFQNHQKISRKEKDEDYYEKYCIFVAILSFSESLLMFPYIISFMLFMILLFLPSLIFQNYKIYLFTIYECLMPPFQVNCFSFDDD